MKNDVQLKKDVEAELEWDPSANARQVGVAVRNGVVTLTGHLNTYAEKTAIEKAVQRVQGVRAIAVDPNTALDPCVSVAALIISSPPQFGQCSRSISKAKLQRRLTCTQGADRQGPRPPARPG